MSDSRRIRIALFCHSIVSDWNHGNAHFLRGLIRSLQQLGHEVVAFEEEGNWSISNLLRDHGEEPVRQFESRFPYIRYHTYSTKEGAELEAWLSDLLGGFDVCLVHEWNSTPLIRAAGRAAMRTGKLAIFHDTHHRALTEPERLPSLGLEAYSAVLAYGPTIAEIYRSTLDGPEVLVFHEAADTDLFKPLRRRKDTDVLFIGNWGDDDRSTSTRQYFIEQARALPDLSFTIHGVRYPVEVLQEISAAGIRWRGWLPNYLAPEAYAACRLTIHIPRKEYLESLRGTPTIRVFEALACGVPLISAGWRDGTGLFDDGEDFIAVDTPSQMTEAIRWLASDEAARARLEAHGMMTILSRHTCRHRAEELVEIVARLRRGEAAG